MNPARRIALDVLAKVATQDAFAGPTLDALAEEKRLAPDDRALAGELAFGVLRWRAALDFALAPHVTRGLDSVAPPIKDLLRLGAYQLLYTRVAPHAAVHETVEQARMLGREPAAGFVNAVLRALQRTGAPRPPDPTRDLAGSLSITQSFPRWLVERTLAELGPDEAEAALAAHNVPGPLTVRINVRQTTREALIETLAFEGITALPAARAPHGLHLQGVGNVTASAAFRAGLYTVQDEASQLVTLYCAPAANARILDLCAAPGGKTTALAEAAPDGHVDALDRIPRKTARITDAVRRLGLGNVAVYTGDAAGRLSFAPEPGTYDLVLLDAPCSGLGVLRRHPEAKWRVQPADLERLRGEQARLLEAAARHVRPGGTLVYSVCTTTPEETTALVAEFTQKNADFAPVAPEGAAFEGAVLGEALRLWPHHHRTDGFFAARFRRVALVPPQASTPPAAQE